MSDNESRGLLDSVNCGALSYGRIGEERVIDTEKHSLAVISIFFPYNPENLIEKTELSEIIIKNGNVTVTVSEDYGMTGGIESITVFRFIVILEKEDLVTLNSDSKYFLNFDYLLFDEAEDTFSMNTVNNFFDLTADGVFDTKDLTRLMRVLAGDEEATVAQSADINGDGAIDTKDLTRMMKYLAGGNE